MTDSYKISARPTASDSSPRKRRSGSRTVRGEQNAMSTKGLTPERMQQRIVAIVHLSQGKRSGIKWVFVTRMAISEFVQ